MKSWLIDTNVLIYSYDQDHELHKISYSFLKQSIEGQFAAVIAQQNLLEFLAVVTHPKRVTHPLSMEQALQKLVIYSTSFSLILPTSKTFFTFTQLISKYPKPTKRIFDFYLAATALTNGINQICTWNVKDFKDITEFVVKTPDELT